MLIASLLILSFLLVFVLGAPRLVEVSPQDGALDVDPDTALRLTFSRRLESEGLQKSLQLESAIMGTYEWQGNTFVFQPDGPWPAGSIIRVQLLPGAAVEGFPSMGLRQGREWSFTVHQLKLGFLFPASGPASLYQQDPDSDKKTLLISSESGLLDFTVGGSEPSIYYSERNPLDGSAVYRFALLAGEQNPQPKSTLPADGKAAEPELVLECQKALCQGLALDPAGRYLAYERTAQPGGEGPQLPQVWILPLPGDALTKPFLAGDPAHQTELPAWSSQGWLSFYDRDEQAYLFVEPGAGEQARFPNQTGQQGAWLSDMASPSSRQKSSMPMKMSPQSWGS